MYEDDPSRTQTAFQPSPDAMVRGRVTGVGDIAGTMAADLVLFRNEAGGQRPLVRLLQLIEQEIQTLLMVGREGLKLDPDAFGAAPPDVRGLNRDGQVLSGKEQEIDHGIGFDPNGIPNSAALSGKIDGLGNMGPIMCHQSARE